MRVASSGPGEMTQRLRANPALAEGLSSFPGIHIRGSQIPITLSPSEFEVSGFHGHPIEVKITTQTQEIRHIHK